MTTGSIERCPSCGNETTTQHAKGGFWETVSRASSRVCRYQKNCTEDTSPAQCSTAAPALLHLQQRSEASSGFLGSSWFHQKPLRAPQSNPGAPSTPSQTPSRQRRTPAANRLARQPAKQINCEQGQPLGTSGTRDGAHGDACPKLPTAPSKLHPQGGERLAMCQMGDSARRALGRKVERRRDIVPIRVH
ncbi:hypothetical protein K402DRAFT_99584 [Aulographum hederae CBS 113979]|uniref:Uncharacterized protein n=1 Tax=Aulographum hederae CBS 113979 TaxID=1176131 RepID=A0A6G1GY84_9PEZI|nr:hypothetical protein K402DRAFT_99584 [Aulographum hederae CBS 113979]